MNVGQEPQEEMVQWGSLFKARNMDGCGKDLSPIVVCLRDSN